VNLSAKEIKEVTAGVLKQERNAVSRLFSLIEDCHPEAFKILSQVYPQTGRAFRIGVTGFPGSGKSSVINRLAKSFLEKKKSVGVILVEAAHPVNGGAMLSDRVRMKDIQNHPDVFIRSMASRRGRASMAQTSRYAADVLDAAGYEVILVETLGVGQMEMDIVHEAHETLMVLTPEYADEAQALRAGLMEVSSFFVVNKMDRDKGKLWFKRLMGALEDGASKGAKQKARAFPVSALSGEGMEELFEALWETLKKQDPLKSGNGKNGRVDREVVGTLGELFFSEIFHRHDISKKIENCREDLAQRKKSPYDVARSLLRTYLK